MRKSKLSEHQIAILKAVEGGRTKEGRLSRTDQRRQLLSVEVKRGGMQASE
jgi:hypothetical protein